MEIDSNVLAQMHRIHSAVNDGTLDRDAVNDALRVLHDLLSGEGDDAAMGQAGKAPTHKPPRKKR